MHFITPVVNETLKLVEADAFTLIHQNSNETCLIKYTGPSNAILSRDQDCVYSVNVQKHTLWLLLVHANLQ